MFTEIKTELARVELTINQACAIEAIGTKTLTPTDLADACNVTRAYITSLRDELLSCGYITQSMNMGDRRELLISLSVRGKAKLIQLNRIKKDIRK